MEIRNSSKILYLRDLYSEFLSDFHRIVLRIANGIPRNNSYYKSGRSYIRDLRVGSRSQSGFFFSATKRLIMSIFYARKILMNLRGSVTVFSHFLFPWTILFFEKLSWSYSNVKFTWHQTPTSNGVKLRNLLKKLFLC